MSAIPSKNKAVSLPFLTAWSPLHRTQVPRCPDLAILLYSRLLVYTYIYIWTPTRSLNPLMRMRVRGNDRVHENGLSSWKTYISHEIDKLLMRSRPISWDFLHGYDQNLQELKATIQQGWPSDKAMVVTPSVRQYFTYRDDKVNSFLKAREC